MAHNAQKGRFIMTRYTMKNAQADMSEMKDMMKQFMEMQSAFNASTSERIGVLEDALKGKGKTTKSPSTKETEKVAFTKHDGTVIYGTQAQVDAWTKRSESYASRKEAFEQMKATWAEKKASYKPSKALKDAILENRASVTHKVAKEKYGFVGTKKDLQALKESICK